MRLDLEAKMASQLTESNQDRYRANPKSNSVNDPSELLDWSARMTGGGLFQESVEILTSLMMVLDCSSRGLVPMTLLKAIEYQDSRRGSANAMTVEYPKGCQLLLRMVTPMLSKAVGSSRNLQLRGDMLIMVQLKTARLQENWQIQSDMVSLR